MISKIVSRTEKNKPNKITASVVLDFFLLDMGANLGMIIIINPEQIRIRLLSLVNIIRPTNPIRIKLTTPLNNLLSGSTISGSL